MLTALSESLIGTDFGAAVDLKTIENVPLNAKLFAESHSRFIVSVKPENKEQFEDIFGEKVFLLGKVTADKKLKIVDNQNVVIDERVAELEDAWRGGK
jgi:phosphoribosylformylglycinamidine synthase